MCSASRSMIYPFPHTRLRMVDPVAPMQYRDEQELPFPVLGTARN